jgi:diguanylate cyclase (GGDEF)-like protein
LLRSGLLSSLLSIIGDYSARIYRYADDRWHILEYHSLNDAVVHIERRDFEKITTSEERENDRRALERLSPERPHIIENGLTVFSVEAKKLALLVSTELTIDECQSIVALITVFNNLHEILQRSTKDALTGLYNRQTFEDKIKQLVIANAQASRVDRPIIGCLAYLDIDHFKSINDKWGHLYGDEVLVLFAQMMSASFRDVDWLFRFGGEEFVVMIAGLDEANAANIVDRFRYTLRVREFPQVGKVTFSAGITEIRSGIPTSELLEEADRALYYAKHSGRDSTIIYQLAVEAGLVEPIKRGDQEDNVVLF